MCDLIRVVDLEVQAHIGVPEEERARAQKLLISLELRVASSASAAATDDLTATVDYFAAAQRVKALVARQPPCKLIETLAERIATDLLEAFPIEAVTVEIKKFILPDARWVAVEMTRTRSP